MSENQISIFNFEGNDLRTVDDLTKREVIFTAMNSGAIVSGIGANSPIRISLLKPYKAHKRRPSAFFVSTFLWWAVWERSRARRFLVGGKANPARSITLGLASHGDGLLKYTRRPAMEEQSLAPNIRAHLDKIQTEIGHIGIEHQLRLEFVRNLLEKIEASPSDSIRSDFLAGIAIDLCLHWEKLAINKTNQLAGKLSPAEVING